MKRIKFLTLAAVAMMVGMTSCNKDNGATPTVEELNVTLNFKDIASRADQAAVTGTPTVTITDGYICFVNAGNSITQVYKIVAGAPGVGEIGNGTGVKTFTAVPGATTQVYLIANVGAVTAPVVNASITTYLSTEVMAVENQNAVADVVIIGSAALTGSATNKAATITPTTKVTRIQIKEIEFDAGFTDGVIEGIYINGFYKQLNLDGTGGTIVSSTLAVDYAGTSAIFGAAYAGVLYDEVGFPGTFQANVTPATAGGVWGYNLFEVTGTPQIIIKLKNVDVGSGNLAQVFATISIFKKAGTPITKFDAAKYYTIDKITIPSGGIGVTPGVTPFAADVTVGTVTWAEEAITGEI